MSKIALLLLVFFAFSAGATRYFPDDAIWYKDISNAPLDSQSSDIINWLASNGGWGNGNVFQVDFSFYILTADKDTPTVPVEQLPDYYLPDCDEVSKFPLPPGGAIEGQDGYTCEDEDCHLLVVDTSSYKLYESYISNVVDGKLQSQCVVVWNMCVVYPANGRGEQCTSTDAAGFPITPLLFTADEVASGEIDHAIRFILPNPRMRAGFYVHPASHAGGPSGPDPAPVYGMRFRLKSSFNESTLSPAAQVVARALKKYGMLLSDGGNIALTAANDRFSENKWNDLGFNSRSLASIQVTDFEVVDAGERIVLTYDCVRNDITSKCDNPPPDIGDNGGGKDSGNGAVVNAAVSLFSVLVVFGLLL